MGFIKTFMYNNGNAAPSRDSVKNDQGWCVYTLQSDTDDRGEYNSTTEQHIFEVFDSAHKEKVLIDGNGKTWKNFRFHDTQLSGVPNTWTDENGQHAHQPDKKLRGNPIRLHIKDLTCIRANVATPNDSMGSDANSLNGLEFDNFCIKTKDTVVTMDNVVINGYGGNAGAQHGGAVLIQNADYSQIDKDINTLNYDISNNNPQYMAGRSGLKDVAVTNCFHGIELRDCFGNDTTKCYIDNCTVACKVVGISLGSSKHKLNSTDAGNADDQNGNSSGGMAKAVSGCTSIEVKGCTVSTSFVGVALEECNKCKVENCNISSNNDGVQVSYPLGKNDLNNNTLSTSLAATVPTFLYTNLNESNNQGYEGQQNNCSINVQEGNNSGVGHNMAVLADYSARTYAKNITFSKCANANSDGNGCLMNVSVDNLLDVQRYNCTGPWDNASATINATYEFLANSDAVNTGTVQNPTYDQKLNAGYVSTANVAGIKPGSKFIRLRGVEVSRTTGNGGAYLSDPATTHGQFWITYTLNKNVIRQDINISNKHGNRQDEEDLASSATNAADQIKIKGAFTWTDFRFTHDLGVAAARNLDMALSGKEKDIKACGEPYRLHLEDVTLETEELDTANGTSVKSWAIDTQNTYVTMRNVTIKGYANGEATANNDIDSRNGGAVNIEGEDDGTVLDYAKYQNNMDGIARPEGVWEDVWIQSGKREPGLFNVDCVNNANGLCMKNVKGAYLRNCDVSLGDRNDFDFHANSKIGDANDESDALHLNESGTALKVATEGCQNITLTNCTSNSPAGALSFRFDGVRDCEMKSCSSNGAVLACLLVRHPYGNSANKTTDMGLLCDGCTFEMTKLHWTVDAGGEQPYIANSFNHSNDPDFGLKAGDEHKIACLADNQGAGKVATRSDTMTHGAAVIYKAENAGNETDAGLRREGRLELKNCTFNNTLDANNSTQYTDSHYAYLKETSASKNNRTKSYGYLVNHRAGDNKNTMPIHATEYKSSNANNTLFTYTNPTSATNYKTGEEYQLYSQVKFEGGLLTNICYNIIGVVNDANSQYNGWLTYELDEHSKEGDSGIVDVFNATSNILIQSKGTEYNTEDQIATSTQFIWKDFQFYTGNSSDVAGSLEAHNYKYQSSFPNNDHSFVEGKGFGTGGESHGTVQRLVIRNLHFKNTNLNQRYCIFTTGVPTTLEKVKVEGYYGPNGGDGTLTNGDPTNKGEGIRATLPKSMVPSDTHTTAVSTYDNGDAIANNGDANVANNVNPTEHETPKNIILDPLPNGTDNNAEYAQNYVNDATRTKASPGGAIRIDNGDYTTLSSMNTQYGQFGRPGIRNCEFNLNHNGIELNGCVNMYVSNSAFSNNTMNHIYVNRNGTTATDNLNLLNNILFNNTDNAIEIKGGALNKEIKITNNDFIRTRGSAIYCNNVSGDIIVENAKCRHCVMGDTVGRNTAGQVAIGKNAGGDILKSSSVMVLDNATNNKGRLIVKNSEFFNGDGTVFQHCTGPTYAGDDNSTEPSDNTTDAVNRGYLFQRIGNTSVEYTRDSSTIHYDGFQDIIGIPAANDVLKNAKSFILLTISLTEAERLLQQAVEGITVSTSAINNGANIQFVLDGAKLEQLLTTIPTLPEQEEQRLVGHAKANATVSLATLKEVFKYTSDGTDIGQDSSETEGSDVIFHMDSTKWVNIPFSGANVLVNQIGPNNVNGRAPTISYDIVRWEAYNIFNHWSAVDMFSNEAALAQDVVNQDTEFNNQLKDGMNTYNGSGVKNDKNYAKELFDQIMLLDPSRVLLQFADDEDVSGNLNTNVHNRSVPLKEGDQIVIKVTYKFAQFNEGIKNLFGILAAQNRTVSDRSYLIHLEVEP